MADFTHPMAALGGDRMGKKYYLRNLLGNPIEIGDGRIRESSAGCWTPSRSSR